MSLEQRPVATSSARAWMTAPKPMAELAGPPAPTRRPRNHRSGHSCTLLTAEPLRLSGSAVSKVQECPLRWFLGRRVGAGGPASSAMGFGAVIHALADDVATGRCSSDIDAVMRRLDQVWGRLQFEAKWQSAQQRAEAYDAVQRLLGWCTSDRGRRLLDTEREFTVDLEVASGPVRLHGRMDRVELDQAGQVHVVDFKTGRTIPSGPNVITDPQLGCYQVAVRAADR